MGAALILLACGWTDGHDEANLFRTWTRAKKNVKSCFKDAWYVGSLQKHVNAKVHCWELKIKEEEKKNLLPEPYEMCLMYTVTEMDAARLVFAISKYSL